MNNSHLTFKVQTGDILGDRWAISIGRLWNEMVKRSNALCTIKFAYNLWQWSQCQLAGLPGREVAGPHILAIAGENSADINYAIDKLEMLLNLSDEIIKEMTEHKIAGIPFTDCKLTSEFRDQFRRDAIALEKKLSLAKCTWNSFLADCARHLGIPRAAHDVMINSARAQFCTRGV